MPRALNCLAVAACSALLFALLAGPAAADIPGTLEAKPLPPLARPDSPSTPAKDLFGRQLAPAKMEPRAIGSYSGGCLAGAVALPVNGDAWQAMRQSRNRNWGHPDLVHLIARLAQRARQGGDWPGLLVGDLSQARGGPMLSGHVSHQIGLDADIWLTPMPPRELTRREREEMPATMVVGASRKDVDPAVWTPGHVALIRAAALEPAVDRIFVNAAIKKALCRDAGKEQRGWLNKVRPIEGHDYHFHVRMRCPRDSRGCRAQERLPAGEGCGPELDWWLRDSMLFPKPPRVPPKPKPPQTMANLPAECRMVLLYPVSP